MKLKSLLVSFVLCTLVLSSINVPAQELTGFPTFETTQVFIRLGGPFETADDPYAQDQSLDRIFLDLSAPRVTGGPDWRSGLPPITANPGHIIFAHAFLTVQAEQLSEFNVPINDDGGKTIYFAHDQEGSIVNVLRHNGMSQPLDEVNINGTNDFIRYPGTLTFNDESPQVFSITLSGSPVQEDVVYYLGAIEMEVLDVQCITGRILNRTEVQPLDREFNDKPDRISDAVIREIIPPPQLVYEDMCKLHTLSLCLLDSEDVADGVEYTYEELILDEEWFVDHLGWDLPNSFNLPLAPLYPFPPFSGFAQLPLENDRSWVQSYYTDADATSMLILKYEEGVGLHVSYRIVDKTGNANVEEIVPVMLAFCIPSMTFPVSEEGINNPAPILIIDSDDGTLEGMVGPTPEPTPAP